jgi:hypothetical protein
MAGEPRRVPLALSDRPSATHNEREREREREKEGQRGREIWKERQRELRKMKRDGERWVERIEKEENEERTKGKAYGLVKQVEETYIDDYEYNDDY